MGVTLGDNMVQPISILFKVLNPSKATGGLAPDVPKIT
jgi:hypothetical protein